MRNSTMMSRAGIAGCAFAGALFALAGSAQAQDTVGPQLDAAYHNYQPPYPDTAQINGEQGNVVLDVQVNRTAKSATSRSRSRAASAISTTRRLKAF